MANTDKGNLININSIIEEKEGKNGGIVISDTNAHAGTFTSILVTSNAVITAVGNITITALTVTAGVRIPGEFTSITLASGSVIAYGTAS
jgi:hypothetical protein